MDVDCGDLVVFGIEALMFGLKNFSLARMENGIGMNTRIAGNKAGKFSECCSNACIPFSLIFVFEIQNFHDAK